jgi:hypothetical protein
VLPRGALRTSRGRPHMHDEREHALRILMRRHEWRHVLRRVPAQPVVFVATESTCSLSATTRSASSNGGLASEEQPTRQAVGVIPRRGSISKLPGQP